MLEAIVGAVRRWRRRQKAAILKQHVEDIGREIERWERNKAKVALTEADGMVRTFMGIQCDLAVLKLKAERIGVRQQLALVEDPQVMLDEALANRTDVH